MENKTNMSTQTASIDVVPFGIEIDHPRNSDVIVQGVGGLRLRSAIKPTKEIFDTEDGLPITRPANAKLIDGLPARLPGMQLHINPEKGTWAVIDPLEGDERTLEKVRRAMASNSGYMPSKTLRGVPPKKGKLGSDEIKTLVREVLGMVESGQASVVEGIKPSREDVDELPGRYLLNQTNRGAYRQPRYEDEVESWANKLNSLDS